MQRDEYWTEQCFLFRGTFRYYHRVPRMVRGFVHTSDEPYAPEVIEPDIVPITATRGTRTYIMIHPYVIERRLTLTVGLYSEPLPAGAIGQVTDGGLDPTRPVKLRQCGDMQGWYYPADQTFVIWECVLSQELLDAPLPEDLNMRELWLGVERWATARFPEARRILTPFRDQRFPAQTYQAFLAALGYGQIARAAWGKALQAPASPLPDDGSR